MERIPATAGILAGLWGAGWDRRARFQFPATTVLSMAAVFL
jgi:hypothetical protein